MRETKKLIMFLFLLIGKNTFSQINPSFIIRHDSLLVSSKSCPQLINNTFYRYKKIWISTKYKIIDSLELRNTKKLKVLILSPINQEGASYRFPCRLVVKRILLIYNENVTHNFLEYITDMLILNQYDFPSDPYLYGESIKSFNKGFSLSFSAGSKVKCDLTLFFVQKNGKFYLFKYTADYYSTGLPHSKDQTFHLIIDENHELNRIKTLKLFDFPDW